MQVHAARTGSRGGGGLVAERLSARGEGAAAFMACYSTHTHTQRLRVQDSIVHLSVRMGWVFSLFLSVLSSLLLARSVSFSFSTEIKYRIRLLLRLFHKMRVFVPYRVYIDRISIQREIVCSFFFFH